MPCVLVGMLGSASKGEIFVCTANGDCVSLAPSGDGEILVSDNSTASGLRYAAYLDGDLGIGEASQGDRVHVYDAADAALRLETATEGVGGYARTKWYSLVTPDPNHPSSIAANTEYLLLMEDVSGSDVDPIDETGNHTFTNLSSVATTTTHEPNHGARAASYDNTDTDECIHSASNVPNATKTIEFWYYQNSAIGNKYLFLASDGGNTLAIQSDGASGIRVINGGNWSAYQTINNGEWYHISVRVNDSGSNRTILRIQDSSGILVGSERTSTGTWQITNCVHHIGNHSVHTVSPDGIMDEVRASTVVRSTFPTQDTYGSAVRTFQGWIGWHDELDRGEINLDDHNLRIDVGTASVDVVGATRLGDGGATNYVAVSASGDVSFVGSAGFYPRRVAQSTIPAAGVGATQIDTGELIIWRDPDDSKVYLVYNDTDSGIKSVEML